MSERPFMQLYVSDFVGDTLPLSTEQIGAYMLILMAMWNAGGRLPDDDAKLARVARLSLKRWRSISADLLRFFEREAGEIGHKRLTRELHKAQVKSEARAAAGARGGAATALKTKAHGAANAGALPRHSPDSRNQSEKASAFSPAGRNTPTPGFSGRKPGWQRPKTHTDAANAIIEEIRSHDRSRTAAGDEGAGRDVLMLPAIRPD
ncbi:YdaU family protein [Mesorhizobium sp. 43Arga]